MEVNNKINVKVNFTLQPSMKAQRGWEYKVTFPSTSTLDVAVWPASRSVRFTTETAPLPVVQETGWEIVARLYVWEENFSLHPELEKTNHPARSESLYRLSYPGRKWK
jgi:hypothetical protein